MCAGQMTSYDINDQIYTDEGSELLSNLNKSSLGVRTVVERHQYQIHSNSMMPSDFKPSWQF